MSPQAGKLPPWLRRPWPAGHGFQHTHETLESLGLQTICTNANCPNRGECWGRGTATVLILGNVCTRNCGFCSVATGRPQPPDPTEPVRLAEMVKRMDIKYLVITSVDRDDLPDGGAGHFHNCIQEVRRQCPGVRFEILTPDFKDHQEQALDILQDALPFVFAHNVETVPSLYPIARVGGDYERSLRLLRMAKERYAHVHSGPHGQTSLSVPPTILDSSPPDAGLQTKSSIMLGLGETDLEVDQVLRDLRTAGCDRLTIGQYLRPSKDALEVVEYVPPEKFACWRKRAMEIGFVWILSAPFARSSYFAEQENAR